MSDRVVVMHGGRVEQVGTPNELYERPRTRFVADFLGSSNFLETSVVSAGAVPLLRTKAGLQFRVEGLDDIAVGDSLTVAIRPERISIDESAMPSSLSRRAHVVDSSYHGDTQRFQVQVDGGDMLTVFRPNVGQPLIPHGTPVTVGWGSRDAWVIPHDGNER